MLTPHAQIVNIAELAKILKTAPNTLKKGWEQLPHIFIGRGRDLRGARFDVQDVIAYLKERDYRGDHANLQQNNSAMDRKNKTGRPSAKGKARIPDKNGGQGLGAGQKAGTKDAGDDPHGLLEGLRIIPGSR
jgi:hypothetical protein